MWAWHILPNIMNTYAFEVEPGQAANAGQMRSTQSGQQINLTYLLTSHPAPEFVEETYYAGKVYGMIWFHIYT